MKKETYQVPDAELLILTGLQFCLQDSEQIDDGSDDGEWGNDNY